MELSTYQRAILDFVRDGSGNGIINAVAGSGKTTTLEQIVRTVNAIDASKSIVMLAFNKSIADELKRRGLPGATFHSAAFSSLGRALYGKNRGRRMKVDARKVDYIIESLFGRRESAKYSGALARLVSLCKNHMYMPNVADEQIVGLISHFDVEWDDDDISDRDMCAMVRSVLEANNQDTLTIDFDDMIYFVIVFRAKLPQYDFVLVDESQDTNPLRREMVRLMCHSRTRVIAVGDTNQAIYGFTGASHDSMDLIRETFSARELPLSICYRCPASVIREAQKIVPHIEARPNAPEGTVLYAETWKRSAFLPTDLLICRNTAPLITTAYKLIAARTPCKIMGREIGRGLIALIKRLSRKNETLESLCDRLNEWCATETAKALAKRQETKAQGIQDKTDSILALIDTMTPEDVSGGIERLCAIIDSMFSDNGPNVTTLATVHKAKGMEAPRVFILDPHLMPSKMARQDWQRQQERNLQYVAITRALETLVYVKSESLVD